MGTFFFAHSSEDVEKSNAFFAWTWYSSIQSTIVRLLLVLLPLNLERVKVSPAPVSPNQPLPVCWLFAILYVSFITVAQEQTVRRFYLQLRIVALSRSDSRTVSKVKISATNTTPLTRYQVYECVL